MQSLTLGTAYILGALAQSAKDTQSLTFSTAYNLVALAQLVMDRCPLCCRWWMTSSTYPPRQKSW